MIKTSEVKEKQVLIEKNKAREISQKEIKKYLI